MALGKSVGKAPPLGTKTKFAEIDEPMSVPALDVVDQTAGIHCGFTAQPSVFAGCGPPNTSTVAGRISGSCEPKLSMKA